MIEEIYNDSLLSAASYAKWDGSVSNIDAVLSKGILFLNQFKIQDLTRSACVLLEGTENVQNFEYFHSLVAHSAIASCNTRHQ